MSPRNDDELFFNSLRDREYSRLDRLNEAYLDYTGTALYAESQVARNAERLLGSVFGNPHSENGPSRSSTIVIEKARQRVLDFLDASSSEYSVCFTANTSAAIKLVGESFDFGPRSSLVLASDNHNSMNGLREFSRRGGASVQYVGLDRELRLDGAAESLRVNRKSGSALFGFPAQSNFSGVKHPLSLIEEARNSGYAVLLDAAAFLPTNQLSLREHSPDFVVFSMYKIAGYPTGVGVLVARNDALPLLERPWFAGGTVEYASIQHGMHSLRGGVEGFEDGTPAFLSIAAVSDALDFVSALGQSRIQKRIAGLTSYLLRELRTLSHRDGIPLVRFHGPAGTGERGGTVAFNVVTPRGDPVPFAAVVDRARDAGVALRGGCFCNPGASEVAFDFPLDASRLCFASASEHGFSVEKLSACLGTSVAVGAVRASVGIPTTRRDIDRAIDVVASFGERRSRATGVRTSLALQKPDTILHKTGQPFA